MSACKIPCSANAPWQGRQSMTTESGVYGKSVPSAMWTLVTGFACRCMSMAATFMPASASFFVTCPAPAPTSKIGVPSSKFRMYVTKSSVGSKNRTTPREVPIRLRRSSFSKLSMVLFLHHVRESEFPMRDADEAELAEHVTSRRQVLLRFRRRPTIEQARTCLDEIPVDDRRLIVLGVARVVVVLSGDGRDGERLLLLKASLHQSLVHLFRLVVGSGPHLQEQRLVWVLRLKLDTYFVEVH